MVAAEEAPLRAVAAMPAEMVRPVLGARILGRESGGGIELDARARFAGGIQLGAVVGMTAFERAYVSGRPGFGAGAVSAEGIFVAPLVVAAPIELDLRLQSGVLAIDDFGEDRAIALRQINELGMFAHVSVADHWLLRCGAVLGVELELQPTVDLADQSQLISLGVGYELTDHLLAYVDATGGGTFGFNGDNGKLLLEGSFGLRLPLGAGGARVAF